MLSESNNATMVSTTSSFFHDIEVNRQDAGRNYHLGTIKRAHLFTVSSLCPTFVVAKSQADAEEEFIQNLERKVGLK